MLTSNKLLTSEQIVVFGPLDTVDGARMIAPYGRYAFPFGGVVVVRAPHFQRLVITTRDEHVAFRVKVTAPDR